MVDNQLLSLLWELRCILNPKAGGSLDCYLVCDGIKKKPVTSPEQICVISPWRMCPH